MNNKIDKDKLKHQLRGGKFYFHKEGLYISSKINMVLDVDKNTLGIVFEGGAVDCYLEKVKPIGRPSNIIKNFEWCYVLRNYLDEIIGYVGE